MTIVLGIETSCDETAVAIVNSEKSVLSHQVVSQLEHSKYGGVVPELASRAHMEALHLLIALAMKESKLQFSDLDAIAVTAGPGLIGGLIVGVMTAKGIADAANKPFVAVNHLEAHSLIVRMLYDLDFPFLLLIISGGHCQFLIAENVGQYQKIGSTLDDSLGEAFDKVAKILGFTYPGGPIIEQQALKGDGRRFKFPRALRGRPGCDFSFSGIKTAVKQLAESFDVLTDVIKSDICASFQECIADILQDRLGNALDIAQRNNSQIKNLVVTGGVAANLFLRNTIERCTNSCTTFFPPQNLCTDNGIMVAWAGLERFTKGYVNQLNFQPKSRWPLDQIVN